jgi:hypothetical protein
VKSRFQLLVEVALRIEIIRDLKLFLALLRSIAKADLSPALAES